MLDISRTTGFLVFCDILIICALGGPLQASPAGSQEGAGQSPAAIRQRNLVRADVVKDADSLQKHTNIALLVGIGDYDRALTGLPALKYPVPDIVSIGKVLAREGYSVSLLEDGEATAGTIRSRFRDLSTQLDKGEGTFIFYFSGHGFRVGTENYLATFGTTLSDLAHQGLPISEVQNLLLETGAKRRMAFIDACRNDPEAKSVGSPMRSFGDLQESEGLRILYSTAPGEVSYEDDTLQHGVFSYYLIEGIAGNAASSQDGLITFDDLREYVTREMKTYSISRGRIQRPYQLGESNGDFLLAKPPSVAISASSGEGRLEAILPPAVNPLANRSISVHALPRAPLMRVGALRSDDVRMATLSPNGLLVALTSKGGVVQLWTIGSGQPITALTGLGKPPFSIEFSPDSKLLVAGGEKGLWLWTVESRTTHKLADKGMTTPLSSAFSPDRKFLVTSGTDKTLRVWNVETTALEASIKLQNHGFWTGFAPDLKMNVVATIESEKNRSVAGLWNWRSKAPPLMLSDSAGVRCLAFSPDGRKLVAGMQDGTIRSWDLSDITHPHPDNEFDGHTASVESLVFTSDGKQLMSAGEDKTFRSWDLGTASQVRSLDAPPGTGKITGMLVAPDGGLLAVFLQSSGVEVWRVPIP